MEQARPTRTVRMKVKGWLGGGDGGGGGRVSLRSTSIQAMTEHNAD